MGVHTVVSAATTAAATPFNWVRHGVSPSPRNYEDQYDPGNGGSLQSISSSPDGPRLRVQTSGSISRSHSNSTANASTARPDSTLNPVPEGEAVDYPQDNYDEEEELEIELEEQGFYKGSYNRLRVIHSLVPLCSLIAFAIFAFLPTWLYPLDGTVHVHAREFLVAISFYSLQHLIRVPLFSLTQYIFPETPSAAILLHTLVRTLLTTVLLLAANMILSIHPARPTWNDVAFRHVWSIGLGWAAAESVIGLAQGYEQLALYRDVMVGNIVLNGLEQPLRVNIGDLEMNQACIEDVHMQVDRDLDYLLAFKGRDEIEEVYGMPYIRIPVVILIMQRLNSIMLAMGVTLILSALHSRWYNSSKAALSPTGTLILALVIATHMFLTSLHTSLLLPRVGVHGAAYVGFVLGLSYFVGGLGGWEGVV